MNSNLPAFPLLPLLPPPQVYRKAVGQMSQGLIRRLTVLSQYEEALVKINATAAERLAALKAKPQAAIQRDMLSICNDPFTVAQQLTHIELVKSCCTFAFSFHFLHVFFHARQSGVACRSVCVILIQSLCTTNYTSSTCTQERLSYIGPEEFVQAFVQKDPLDNDKVTSAFLQKLKE